jgi:hypothetical protein
VTGCNSGCLHRLPTSVHRERPLRRPLEPERQQVGPSAGAPPFSTATRAEVVVCDSKTVRRRQRPRALALTASSSSLMCGLARPRRARPCAADAATARPRPSFNARGPATADAANGAARPGRARPCAADATMARRLARRGLSAWRAHSARDPASAGPAAARLPQQRLVRRLLSPRRGATKAGEVAVAKCAFRVLNPKRRARWAFWACCHSQPACPFYFFYLF